MSETDLLSTTDLQNDVRTGFVAFIDILGFSNIIQRDGFPRLIQQYKDGLIDVVRKQSNDIEYVIFSDSIIFCSENDTIEDFIGIIKSCSEILYSFLRSGIPIRGCVSYGEYYFTPKKEHGAIIAGRPIIDAFQYEKQQNWVGIIISPTVIEKFPNLEIDIELKKPHSVQQVEDILSRLPLPLILTKYAIPFNVEKLSREQLPYTYIEDYRFSGIAIIPHPDTTQFQSTMIYHDRTQKRLEFLKSIAPSPTEQLKYTHSLTFMNLVSQNWKEIETSRFFTEKFDSF